MDFSPPFGTWLKQRRRALGLTQHGLAQRVSYAVVTLRKVETGHLQPSPVMAERLAVALEVPLEQHAAFLAFARGIPQPGRRDNLPTPLTPLVGRVQELQVLRNLLLRADVRLLTLFGPPGVGKTRLAIEVAHHLHDDFAGGVVFVPLAAVLEPASFGPSVMAALGVRPLAGYSLLDNLAYHLRNQPALLVLDNFEHLLAAAPFVAQLLSVVAPLKILVTSRALLHVSGEYAVEVTPLACPPHASAHPVERMGDGGDGGDVQQYAAVELFVQRAQAAKPTFRLDAANAPAVAEICRRVDGLPLALELAAVRMRMFRPQVLLTHLDHHMGKTMQLLAAGAHDLPAHQQTLQGTLAWSYDLLSPAEQQLLRRLSIFVGGCTLEAAQAVCDFTFPLDDAAERAACGERLPFEADYDPTLSSERRIAMADLLESLLDKSLIQQSEGLDGATRFTLLTVIREYAWMQLEASGERETLQGRCLRYYTQMAVGYDDERQSVKQSAWLRILAAEYSNLRAAIAWSLQPSADAVMSVRLLVALTWFWIRRAYQWGRVTDVDEMRGWLNQTLAMRPALPLDLQAKVCHRLGWIAFNQGDTACMVVYGEQFLTLRRQIGNKEGLAYALYATAVLAHALGDYERAETLLSEQVALSRELDMKAEVNSGLGLLGYVALDRGDFGRAIDLLEQALTIARETGIINTLAMTGGVVKILRDLGLAQLLAGDTARAESTLEQDLALCRSEDNKYSQSLLQLYLAQASLVRGDPAAAIRRLQDSIRTLTQFGESILISVCLGKLCEALWMEGRPLEALRMAGAAAVNDPQPGDLAHRYTRFRLDYERTLARMRACLDNPAYAAAWAEGQAMTLPQAVDMALAA
jgi:predicted ATPase/DNA-binding XRE family transcriptional regulator